MRRYRLDEETGKLVEDEWGDWTTVTDAREDNNAFIRNNGRPMLAIRNNPEHRSMTLQLQERLGTTNVVVTIPWELGLRIGASASDKIAEFLSGLPAPEVDDV